MNLKALLTGDVNRLRYVTRYSSIFTLHKENVAEHSFYVGFYAMIIGSELNYRCRVTAGENYVDMGKLLSKALIHDLEESRTGDVTRSFKHSSEALRVLIEERSKSEVETAIQDLDLDSRHELQDYWNDSKDDSIEGRIIAFCDFLSVLSYMIFELNASNHTMWHQHETMIKYTQKFDDQKFDFIREWVNEAKEMTMEKLSHAR